MFAVLVGQNERSACLYNMHSAELTDVPVQRVKMNLQDPGPSSKKVCVAELTRPARQILANAKEKTKKSSGRKATNVRCPATYHNWHTPLLWSQIKLAAVQVGWQMNAMDICRRLKQRDADTFAGISRSTVEGWIDRTGNKPCWNEATLHMEEQGNEQGHSKGGRQSIFVSDFAWSVGSILTSLHAVKGSRR